MDDLSSMSETSGIDGQQGKEGDFTLTPMSSCTHVHMGKNPFVLTKRLVIPQVRKARNAA